MEWVRTEQEHPGFFIRIVIGCTVFGRGLAT